MKHNQRNPRGQSEGAGAGGVTENPKNRVKFSEDWQAGKWQSSSRWEGGKCGSVDTIGLFLPPLAEP